MFCNHGSPANTSRLVQPMTPATMMTCVHACMHGCMCMLSFKAVISHLHAGGCNLAPACMGEAAADAAPSPRCMNARPAPPHQRMQHLPTHLEHSGHDVVTPHVVPLGHLLLHCFYLCLLLGGGLQAPHCPTLLAHNLALRDHHATPSGHHACWRAESSWATLGSGGRAAGHAGALHGEEGRHLEWGEGAEGGSPPSFHTRGGGARDRP
jgi:hypothetical protein